MNKKSFKKIIPLLILSLAIFLVPSFNLKKIGGVEKAIEIRLEDILLAVFCISSFLQFLIKKEYKIKKPPLFLPILLWISFSVFTTLLNWILGNIRVSALESFFYLLKEIEFAVLFFYFYNHLKDEKSVKVLSYFLFALILLNSLFSLWQIASGNNFGEYLASAFSERGVFPTGSFFNILFIFSMSVYLYYFLDLKMSFFKKAVLGAIALSPSMGVMGSASKTAFLGIFLSLFLMAIFVFFRKKIRIRLVSVFLVFLFVCLFFNFTVQKNFKMQRITSIMSFGGFASSFEIGRADPIIKPLFDNFINKPVFFQFLGLGKGFVGEAHNQYVRNLVEIGIIGSLMFLFLIFVIMKKALKMFFVSADGFSAGLSCGLLVSTIIMLFFSIATEPFIVVKVSEVYWIFTSMTMAYSDIKNKHE